MDYRPILSRDYKSLTQPPKKKRNKWVLLAAVALATTTTVISLVSTEESTASQGTTEPTVTQQAPLNTAPATRQITLELPGEPSASNAASKPMLPETNTEQLATIQPAAVLEDHKAVESTDTLATSGEVEAAQSSEPKLDWQETIVKSGDTLAAIFKRHDLSASTLYKLINSDEQNKQLTRIKPGQSIQLAIADNGELQGLRYAINTIDTLVISKAQESFTTAIESKTVQKRLRYSSATIEHSLFGAAQEAGISGKLTMELAGIFGWDVDFVLDIRKGDAFNLLYEEVLVDGEYSHDGDIVAAEFINRGKKFQAIRFTDSQGNSDYYTPEGLSMRKAFLRTPVNFTRISSRFSLGRKHPILNKIRSHKGVDYAARTGTPIKAAGDGKIIFRGTKGGYGRTVIIQHGGKYQTLYAHMNSFSRGLRSGSRVKQGQVVGYVGQSGLATGPHLHYEFRVNGVHRNPLTVKLPDAAPIAKQFKQDFLQVAQQQLSQLQLRQQTAVAMADAEQTSL